MLKISTFPLINFESITYRSLFPRFRFFMRSYFFFKETNTIPNETKITRYILNGRTGKSIYSMSSGLTGWDRGITLVLSRSLDKAFLISAKQKHLTPFLIYFFKFHTISIFIWCPRVIFQNSPVNYVAKIFVHINGYSVGNTDKQINKESFFPKEFEFLLKLYFKLISKHRLYFYFSEISSSPDINLAASPSLL